MKLDFLPVNIGDVFIKKTDFWIIKRRAVGLNGLGLPWMVEQWIWPNGEVCRSNDLSLSEKQTSEMLKTFTKQ